MEFHPQKCEIINISRKRHIVHYPYTLHGHQLKHVEQTKYLGVTITQDFRWSSHVDIILTKANSTLNFLRRNINIKNQTIKGAAYKTLVRPILEYASSVWDPSSALLSTKLEKVQRRAARFTLCDYNRTSSVGAMLQQLAWPTLAVRRKNARLAMLYKIQNDLVKIDRGKYLEPKCHRFPTRKENSHAFVVPTSDRDYHKYSFFPRTIREWNVLPESIVRSGTIDAFKQGLLLVQASP